MNNLEWKMTPDAPGIYYYADSPLEWDIPKIARVRKIEEATRIFYEATVGNVTGEASKFAGAIWFGPLPKPTVPTKEFLDKNKKELDFPFRMGTISI